MPDNRAMDPLETPAPTPYELLGGDAGVKRLVEHFYDLMDLDPEFERLRAVHGSSLVGAREKLYLFLSGWLGGPPLYMQRHGHPMLRARHLPFSIGEVERDQWMACMVRAMEEVDVPAELRRPLAAAFFKTADWMRNRPG
jgi:hemoglobin